MKIPDIRKQINEHLASFWLTGAEALKFNLQFLMSYFRSIDIVWGGGALSQTSESFLKIKAHLMGGVGGHA